MNLLQKRAAAVSAAQSIADTAKAAGRDFTAAELVEVQAHIDNIKSIDVSIKAADDSQAVLNSLNEYAPGVTEETATGDRSSAPKSLGEHFWKHAGQRMIQAKGVNGASSSAPEFKAPGDTIVRGALSLPQIDTNIVQGLRVRPTVADLLGVGTLNASSITYFVEGLWDGDFTTVLEGGAKPQMSQVNPTTVTEALSKIAGFIKLSDEMIEDFDFIVSEINQRLLYKLAMFEEAQLLNGNGTAPNLRGMLNRVGIQTEVSAAAAGNADSIFKGITKVGTGSGLTADGLIIHPTDYQTLRLAKDANLQYYGGGFFQGAYGNGDLQEQPPLWGLRTVVTPAIAAGTVLVGSFKQATTVYRKGGVRVESTNSHASDFTSNLVTIRAEERIALAVRVPAALVKVTLSAV